MIYNLSHRPPEDIGHGVRVFDGSGQEHYFVVEVDTEEGRITKYVVENRTILIDPDTLLLVKSFATVPLPIRLLGKKPDVYCPPGAVINIWRFKGCDCQTWVRAECPVYYAHRKPVDLHLLSTDTLNERASK